MDKGILMVEEIAIIFGAFGTIVTITLWGLTLHIKNKKEHAKHLLPILKEWRDIGLGILQDKHMYINDLDLESKPEYIWVKSHMTIYPGISSSWSEINNLIDQRNSLIEPVTKKVKQKIWDIILSIYPHENEYGNGSKLFEHNIDVMFDRIWSIVADLLSNSGRKLVLSIQPMRPFVNEVIGPEQEIIEKINCYGFREGNVDTDMIILIDVENEEAEKVKFERLLTLISKDKLIQTEIKKINDVTKKITKELEIFRKEMYTLISKTEGGNPLAGKCELCKLRLIQR